MYVAPTPFALAEGTAHHRTLILPVEMDADEGVFEIATLKRREADWITVSYTFDLLSNDLDTAVVANPNAGREHEFKAYRMDGDNGGAVQLRESGE